MTHQERSALLRMAGNIASGVALVRFLFGVGLQALGAYIYVFAPHWIIRTVGAALLLSHFALPAVSRISVRIALNIFNDERLAVTDEEPKR